MDQKTAADTAALQRVWARVQRREEAPPLPAAAWDADAFLREQLEESGKRLALCRGAGALQEVEAICRRQYRRIAARLYLRTGACPAPVTRQSRGRLPERCRLLYLSFRRSQQAALSAPEEAGDLGALLEQLGRSCEEGMERAERILERSFS